MILFGRKAHHLAVEELPSKKCSKCGKKEVVISLFQKYFHILWIPIFPIKKAAATQCTSCRNVELKGDFTEEVKELELQMKKKYRTPFWTFAGLYSAIVFFLIKQIVFR